MPARGGDFGVLGGLMAGGLGVVVATGVVVGMGVVVIGGTICAAARDANSINAKTVRFIAAS